MKEWLKTMNLTKEQFKKMMVHMVMTMAKNNRKRKMNNMNKMNKKRMMKNIMKMDLKKMKIVKKHNLKKRKIQ
jgi:hypothetical protein